MRQDKIINMVVFNDVFASRKEINLKIYHVSNPKF